MIHGLPTCKSSVVKRMVRMYNTIKSSDYEFAKDAWYNPLEMDKRCPIMVAKGYRTPDTPDKMIEFQDTAKTLEHEFRGFIDAWDFGVISIHDIEATILYLLECGSIEIREYSASSATLSCAQL